MDFARNHRGSGSNHHSRSGHESHHHHHHRDRERERLERERLERDRDYHPHSHHHSSSGHRHSSHHHSSSRDHHRLESRGHNHHETAGHHPPPPPPSHRGFEGVPVEFDWVMKKITTVRNVIQTISAMTTADLDRGRITAHLTAGLLAGIVSRTLTAPLDRVKVISQISGKNVMPHEGITMMMKEGGFWSMWRGNFANVLKVAPEISMKFLVYNEMKGLLSSHSPDKETNTRHRLMSGFLAGAVSHAMIHPLEVCKTRLTLRKTGEEHRLIAVAVSGYRKYGVRFFLKGFKSSILGIAMFACIDFATYEQLKTFIGPDHSYFSSIGGVLLCGTLSSLLGILVCFPIALVGVNLMASDEKKNVTKFIVNRGFRGMYSGLPAALFKGVPTYALSYVTYEHVIRCMGYQMI